MKKILSLVLVGFAVVLASCSQDTPKAVAEKFVNAFYHRDFKKAMSLATPSSREQLDMLAQFSSELPESSKQEAEKIKIKMGKEEINGDKAVVYYTTSEGDLEQRVNLVKVNNKWLVEWNKQDSPAQDKTTEVPAVEIGVPNDTVTMSVDSAKAMVEQSSKK